MNEHLILLESICIKNGRVQNIAFHNSRANHSRRVLLQKTNPLKLRKFIDVKNATKPFVKCRILYSEDVMNIEYEEYTFPNIDSLKIVMADDLEYSHKYNNRTELKSLFDKREDCDDILIVKNGLITDTYYANVAFQKKDKWYTPSSPLLVGTMRAKLLKQGKIIERKIYLKDLKKYDEIALFNAMIPFKKITIPVINILK